MHSLLSTQLGRDVVALEERFMEAPKASSLLARNFDSNRRDGNGMAACKEPLPGGTFDSINAFPNPTAFFFACASSLRQNFVLLTLAFAFEPQPDYREFQNSVSRWSRSALPRQLALWRCNKLDRMHPNGSTAIPGEPSSS